MGGAVVSGPTLPDWLRAEYPFASHHRDALGGRMHYLDEGNRAGEAVLMLHGNPTWSFFYRDVVKALAPDYRCIVPDHIGCGLSNKPQNWPYRLADHIANVEALVRDLGIERLHLIVHDWGGAIGSGFAVRHPDAIASLTVTNTAAFRSDLMPWQLHLCRMPLVGELLIRGFNAFAGLATRMAVTRPLPDAVKRGFVYPYRSWHDRIATHRFVQDIPMGKSHPSWPTLIGIEEGLERLVGKPIQLLWGERDFVFTPAFRDAWRERFPAAAVTSIPDAGHYLFEDAGETLIPKVRTFLEANRISQ